MLQTIAHRDAPPGLLDRYGMIIVDECHCLGAPAAAAATNDIHVRRWLGLTATPFRADGMDDIITMQCGPVRHEITAQVEFIQHMVTHPTTFVTEQPGTDGASIQAIYGELATDDARTKQICANVAHGFRRGRHTLVLTTRLGHLHAIADNLTDLGIQPLLLHGGQTTAERAATRTALASQPDTPRSRRHRQDRRRRLRPATPGHAVPGHAHLLQGPSHPSKSAGSSERPGQPNPQ